MPSKPLMHGCFYCGREFKCVVPDPACKTTKVFCCADKDCQHEAWLQFSSWRR